MTTLIRWIVGPCKPLGLEVLKESVRTATKLYPECDFVICHNGLNAEQLTTVQSLGVPLHAQKHEILPWEPQGMNWKLYPPRMRFRSCEIVLDNDVVIVQRVPEIETLLRKHIAVVCRGINRNFGKFDKRVPKGYKLNSGLYGMPPGFDFEKAVVDILRSDRRNGWGPFDDQGIIAATIGTGPHSYITNNVALLPADVMKPLPTTCIYHFIGANRVDWHPSWAKYKRKYELT